jgi:teichuronopeptide biosynthesis TupA-like protein
VFGRYPNLLRPRRFTEKIQWRKLFDLNPLYQTLSDKIAAREFIISRVGEGWLPELLWSGESTAEIPFEQFRNPYILKYNHTSGFTIVVSDPASVDRENVKRELQAGLAFQFGQVMREPGYIPIRPRLLAEHLMLESNGLPPLEHKIFVFGGRVEIIWTIYVDRNRTRFDAVYSRDWKPLGWRCFNKKYDGAVPRPHQLRKFIELAETIGAELDHIRVDFYDWNDRPVVGELTLYNLSGNYRFHPDSVDFVLGSWWTLKRPVFRALESTMLGLPQTIRGVARRLRLAKH